MQTTSSSSTTISAYASTKFTSDRSFDLSDNQIFQNLLKNSSVSQYVEQEADGSYEWNWTSENGPLTGPQGIAKWLIGSADGTIDGDNEPCVTYMQSDVDLFKKLTGYNLILTPGGASTACDDYGNGIPEAEEGRISAAWDLIDTIAFAREDGSVGTGPVTLSDLPQILNRYGGRVDGNFDEAEAILEDFMKVLGADDATIAKLQRTEFKGSEGESYATFSLPDDMDFSVDSTSVNLDEGSTTEELLEILS
jgi:hypothetical protein